MFVPNKFTEFFRTLGVRSFLFLALAMLSVVLLCSALFQSENQNHGRRSEEYCYCNIKF